VREIATLHQGSVSLGNALPQREPTLQPDWVHQGALAVLWLPAVKG
jgi:hypothetical protein